MAYYSHNILHYGRTFHTTSFNMQALFARTPCGPIRTRHGGLQGPPEGGARAPGRSGLARMPHVASERAHEMWSENMALGREDRIGPSGRDRQIGTPCGGFGFATLRDAAPGCGASVRERGGKDGPPVTGDGSILRAESREPRAESREPRAESREPRAESREPRAESREPRAGEPRAGEPRAELCPRELRPERSRGELAGRRRAI